MRRNGALIFDISYQDSYMILLTIFTPVTHGTVTSYLYCLPYSTKDVLKLN